MPTERTNFIPVVLPQDGSCIIWGCSKPRTKRNYCGKHYRELIGKTVTRNVKITGHWQTAPNGRKYYRPPSVQKRVVRVPVRELEPWKYREKPDCATEGCEIPSHARGLCRKCYERAIRRLKGAKDSKYQKLKPVGELQAPFAYARGGQR